jgi:hypothetical protein
MPTNKTTVSVRYAVQGLNQLHDDTLPKQSQYPGNGAFRDALNQNLTGTISHSFTPRLINDVRVGYSRFRVEEEAQDQSFNASALGVSGFNIPSRAMPTVFLNGLDQQYSGAVPGFAGAYRIWYDPSSATPQFQLPTLDYLFPMARIGAPLNAPSGRKDTTIFAADNVSWTHGKHTIKAGLEYRHLSNLFTNSAWQRGFWYSSDIGEFTHDSNSTHGPINRRAFVRFRPDAERAVPGRPRLLGLRGVCAGHHPPHLTRDPEPGHALRVLLGSPGVGRPALEFRSLCQRTGAAGWQFHRGPVRRSL